MIGKKEGVCFKFSSQSSFKDGLSLTEKEKSLHMDEEAEKNRILAVLVCIISVVFALFLGVSAFVCAAVTDSSAGYAFALDCVLDVIAGTLILWRFNGSSSTYSSTREYVACLSLGILFCMAAVGIACKSVYHLIKTTIPQQLMYVFILTGVGGAVNSVLGVAMYLLGKKMRSQSLLLEAMNTSLSALLALMLAISDVLYFYIPSAWTIDPISSIIVAFILLVSGVRALRQKREKEEFSPLLIEGHV